MKSIVSKMAKLREYDYLRDSTLMVGVSGLSSLFFLLVHVVAGRLLDGDVYASFASLLGLLFILNVAAGAVQVAVARYASEHAHDDDLELWTALIHRVSFFITIGGTLGLVLWCMGSSWLAELLHAPSASSLILLGLVAFFGLYTPILSAGLQGARRFGWLALSSLLPAMARLGGVTVAALVSGGVNALLIGVIFSAIVGILVSVIPVWSLIRVRPAQRYDMSPILKYFVPVLIGRGVLQLFMNADLILFPRLLTGNEFQAYGKASTLARTILFLPLPVAVAMFPRAVVSRSRMILYGPALFSLVVCVAGASLMSLWPELPLKLMYGVEGEAYNVILKRYVWAVIPVALVQIVSFYVWARHHPLWLVALAPIALLYLYFLSSTQSALQVVNTLGVFSTIFLAGLGCFVLRGKYISDAEKGSA